MNIDPLADVYRCRDPVGHVLAISGADECLQ